MTRRACCLHRAQACVHTLMCWVQALALCCGAREASLQAAALLAAHRCRRRRTPLRQTPAKASMQRFGRQVLQLCQVRLCRGAI